MKAKQAIPNSIVVMAIVAFVMAGLWVLLMLFATAIGSKPPTALEYLSFLWPSLVAAVLAIGSIMMAARGRMQWAVISGLGSLIAVPFGVAVISS